MHRKFSEKTLYIFEATLEYFISILVAGSYLATLTQELGFSDSLTGILSSVISLGCLFQLISIFVLKQRVKGFVIVLSIINQLLFTLLYVIPLFDLSRSVKTVIFVISIFTAYLLYNIAHPKKINFLMSLVEDDQRGRFTANKEIFSLATGIVFSYGMGWIIDHFKDRGDIRLSFIISAATIFLLMLLHTLTLLPIRERESAAARSYNLGETIKKILKNKTVFKITLVFILYYIANYAAVPFYGVYCINELGFSLKTVSLITIFGSVSRIAVSKYWGKYADKNSFAKMIERCFVFLGGSFLVMVFAVPANGLIMYTLYMVLHSVALGGINSALINLIYDYVDVADRANSLATTQAFAGLTGFLTTLAISPLVALIQKSNTVFGITVYAQQAVSLFSLFISAVLIIYIRKVVLKIRKS